MKLLIFILLKNRMYYNDSSTNNNSNNINIEWIHSRRIWRNFKLIFYSTSVSFSYSRLNLMKIKEFFFSPIPSSSSASIFQLKKSSIQSSPNIYSNNNKSNFFILRFFLRSVFLSLPISTLILSLQSE